MKQRSLLFLFTIALASAAVTFSDSTLAGRYELIQGKGVEVCEAYQKNLNSFEPHTPMICDRQVNPEMKDFKKPEWKKVDAWENRQLLRKINRFLGIGMAEDWEDSLKWDIEHGHLLMNLSQIDIDNDGTKENVLKYYDGACPSMKGHYGTPLLVLTENKQDIDIKTVSLMQNPKSAAGDTIPGIWAGTMYDVFLYKGKTYFDRWSESQNQTGYLKVFITETDILASGITKEICRYRFK